jgi:3-dehydroquinate dehydratase type I
MLEELEMRVAQMMPYQPAIYKFATYCHSPHDALRLLQFGLALQDRGFSCVVLGMGEYGSITRIFGSQWFNRMIFAPPTLAGASAPGQLSRPQLENIFQNLRKT